ncbi:hypothetical protein ACN9M1_27855 (plasmid) [Ralstonia sp. R-29]|uniref:hypothetical protein n=1 Tax=Ralstonia sp. R-29 TaxID=3404059 RepID=UPI003CF10A9A
MLAKSTSHHRPGEGLSVFFAILDVLAWPLSVLTLVYSVWLWQRGSYVARNGRRITRQGHPGRFWFEVAATLALAGLLAAFAWTHWFANWAR